MTYTRIQYELYNLLGLKHFRISSFYNHTLNLFACLNQKINNAIYTHIKASKAQSGHTQWNEI